jgi:oligopeptide/dipeptide ABC transporter ATP-binding protein
MSVQLISIIDAKKEFRLRRNLHKVNAFCALDGVSIDVIEGRAVGLVGESGSGKSTLGRCILCLIPVDSGRIIFESEEIQDLNEKKLRPFRKKMQMIFQNPKMSLNPVMTIGRSLLLSMYLRDDLTNQQKKELALDLLNNVQLDLRFFEAYPSEMSGGELQRAALARSLATEPKFLFLDEPTSALDMSNRGQIINLLLGIKEKKGLACIFVSHDLSLISYVADYIYVMYMGSIVESGLKREIFNSPKHPYTQALLSATMIGRDKRTSYFHMLKGDVGGQIWNGRGCKLQSRCPFVKERCFIEPQELKPIFENHEVRCWQVFEA